jgi:metal-dependent HD superfamily phosphatase/phosphodiesterase
MEKKLTLEDLKQDRMVDTFIRLGNQYLGEMGYTEHGYRHLGVVISRIKRIMQSLEFSEREVELAAIAAYMHDIGNVVNRVGHSQSGALLAYHILTRHGMPLEEISVILAAIGNHDEGSGGVPVNAIAAALILADKSDVHRSRVRNQDIATFDIHDRVNYAVEDSDLRVDGQEKTITMELKIDISICPVMEYFEIFLTRMVLCRRAASFLKTQFRLLINDARLL